MGRSRGGRFEGITAKEAGVKLDSGLGGTEESGSMSDGPFMSQNLRLEPERGQKLPRKKGRRQYMELQAAEGSKQGS